MGDGDGVVPTDSKYNRWIEESDDAKNTRIQYLGWDFGQSKAEQRPSFKTPYLNGYRDLQRKVGHGQKTGYLALLYIMYRKLREAHGLNSI